MSWNNFEQQPTSPPGLDAQCFQSSLLSMKSWPDATAWNHSQRACNWSVPWLTWDVQCALAYWIEWVTLPLNGRGEGVQTYVRTLDNASVHELHDIAFITFLVRTMIFIIVIWRIQCMLQLSVSESVCCSLVFLRTIHRVWTHSQKSFPVVVQMSWSSIRFMLNFSKGPILSITQASLFRQLVQNQICTA